MKSLRKYPKLEITKKGSLSVQNGHPWIYEDEVLTGQEGLENGCLVDAVTENGRYLGTGLLSLSSRIRIRILSRNANDRFDEAFWKRRFTYAWQYRKTVMPDDLECCRVIFGEADGCPGLTVDRYADLLSVQCLSFGMEKRKDLLYPLLVDVLRSDGQEIRGIYERNDNMLRRREGLEVQKGWATLPGEPLPDSAVREITENGIRYLVDVENGQKTGFFLDQKYNRLAVSRIAAGKRVLDCFTHTGSFALNAAAGGASHVTAVDVSEAAISMARENAERNGLSDRVDFVTADVFELLTALCERGGEPYDFIILDPPAFTKSRETAANAERGYKDINYRAMKLLPRGGYLATASCSHFMPAAQFERMLRAAAADAGRSLRQIEVRQQAPDHPILWNVPETDYLKFYLLQVV
ncbi:MAG: class I SAM-dependent rRNA methyltransferase [Oscillospiraceae bacterium]|nr:class I SAM-dependent rRNA methyltransferase [Oscillospiraceae bacterium]